MELLEGRSLAERLTADGRPPLDEALWLLAGILEALAAAHQAGVIHRDLKPSNVFLLNESPGPAQVKLLDFGVARREGREEQLTAPEMAVGSVGYMAPEQLMGQAVAASDLYAVGCLAFQLLAGRPVFPLKNIPEAARRHLTEPAPKLRTVRPEASELLEGWVAMLLEKDVAARPRTAEAALRALDAVRAELTPVGDPKTEPSLSRSPALSSFIRANKRTEVVPAFEPPSGGGSAATKGPVPALDTGERPTAREHDTRALQEAPGDKTLLDS
jgi:serine/threonine-protein kinase